MKIYMKALKETGCTDDLKYSSTQQPKNDEERNKILNKNAIKLVTVA